MFATDIGRCGVVWNGAAILGIQLPEKDGPSTRRRIVGRHPGATEGSPPSYVKQAIDAIGRQLAGGRSDLPRIPLDMDGVPAFARCVYQEARSIPAGTTITYGQLAARIGNLGAARAVGQALGRNPFPIVVPCHRIVAAGGRIGGFSAEGGVRTKQRLLAIENAWAEGSRTPRRGQKAVGFDTRRAVRRLRSNDPEFGRVIDAIGPCTMELRPAANTFSALCEAIVHQQLSPKAAATIHGRFRRLFSVSGPGGRGLPTPVRVLALSDADLRGVGLSGAKVRAIRDLALRSVAGGIPTLQSAQSLSDEVIVERLSAVRGVGRWTAEMFLMFRLGRPDVLPLDDYGLRRGFATALNEGQMPEARELEQRGELWRPYRTVASWYLWRAAEANPA